MLIKKDYKNIHIRFWLQPANTPNLPERIFYSRGLGREDLHSPLYAPVESSQTPFWTRSAAVRDGGVGG